MTKQKSNKELVAAGHAFAKAQGAEAPLTEIAKLVSDLATRLDVINVLSYVLTAENLALKNYIDGECYVESKRTGVYTCAGISKPETPATDVILNEVRAQAILNALDSCSPCCDTDCVMDALDISYEDAELRSNGAIELHDGLAAIAAQLRASKDGE